MERLKSIIHSILPPAILALLSPAIFMIYHYCGSKDPTIVKIPNPNQPISVTCGGVPVGNVEQRVCQQGNIGSVTAQCVDKGDYAEWVVVESSCRPAPDQCEDEAQYKVTFKKNVKPLIDRDCMRCHASIRLNEYASAKEHVDEMIRRINLDDLNTQRMPPSPIEPLSFSDREIFKKWLDDGLIEDTECSSPDDQGSLRFNELEDLEGDFLEALQKVDARGQRNMRIITADHKANLGSKKEEMDIYYSGINKAVNALSNVNGDPVPCVPIDDIQGACRIDLENLGLTTADWDLITANADLTFESQTNVGRLIKELTGARIPWLTADQLIQSALAKADVYYTVMDIPADRDTYLAGKGVNLVEDFQTFRARLGGGFGSPISLQKNRLIGFLRSDDGTCSITFDPIDLNGNDRRNLFKNPLVFIGEALFEFAASEVICTLPNGEMEMTLWNAAGVRQNAAPTNVVADVENPFGDFEIAAAKDCYRCHSNGLIPFRDQVRSAITGSPTQLSKQDIDFVKLLYGSQGELDAQFIAHNDRYKSYKQRIKVTSPADPINYWGDRFLKEWTLKDVCAFIRFPLNRCREEIGQSSLLSAQIGSLLTGGTISINQFKDVFNVMVAELRIGQEPLERQ